MGVFDQTSRYAAKADPAYVPTRLAASSGLNVEFVRWYDTRSITPPAGSDRTADLIAEMSSPVGPWLLVVELQSRPDPAKLESSLEQVAALRVRERVPGDASVRYRVIAGVACMTGRQPADILDMTAPDGRGTRHSVRVWNLADDDAASELGAVAQGRAGWGTLFWVPLMRGGGEADVISRWREVLDLVIVDPKRRGDVAFIADVFASLAGRAPAWRRKMQGIELTESDVVNEWILKGAAQEAIARSQLLLLGVLRKRFPAQVSSDVVALVADQDSVDRLFEWMMSAATAETFEGFLEAISE